MRTCGKPCSLGLPQGENSPGPLLRRLPAVLGLALVVIMTASAAVAAEPPPKSTPTVVVEAEGQVLAKPDKAVLNFSVVTQAPQPQEAAQANAREAEKFLAAIKAVLGKEDKVQTQDYRVLPVFKTKEKVQGREKTRTDEIAGYRAQHRFTVELRDLAKIGQISDTALKNGASQVLGPYLGHSQEEELQRQAAVKALEQARKLAEALAGAAGLKVARVLKISTAHELRPRLPMARALRRAGVEEEVETPMEIGEITFHGRLTVTFELAP